MRFASLGSGSKGNATLVVCGDTALLIDCGFTLKETERRLARLGWSPNQLSAILVTHEHGDHLRGVMPLAKKYQLEVYMTAGTGRQIQRGREHIRQINAGSGFRLGAIDALPVAVPHDAREPVQYVLKDGELTLGILTDLGSVTPHVVEQYRHCDGLLLEANHDTLMLRSGPYPYRLQQRVGGNWGHLNNHQALGLLQQLDLQRMQHLVLAHISQQNNTLAAVRGMMAEVETVVPATSYACQDEGFDWIELQPKQSM